MVFFKYEYIYKLFWYFCVLMFLLLIEHHFYFFCFLSVSVSVVTSNEGDCPPLLTHSVAQGAIMPSHSSWVLRVPLISLSLINPFQLSVISTVLLRTSPDNLSVCVCEMWSSWMHKDFIMFHNPLKLQRAYFWPPLGISSDTTLICSTVSLLM